MAKKKNRSVVEQVSGRVFVTPKIAKAQARMGKKAGQKVPKASEIKKGIPNDGIIDYTHTIKARPYTKGQAFVKVDGYDVLLKTAKLQLTEKQKAKHKESIEKKKDKRAAKKAAFEKLSEEEQKKVLKRQRKAQARKREAAKIEAMTPAARKEYLKAKEARKAGKKAKPAKPISARAEIEAKVDKMTEEQRVNYLARLAIEGLQARKAKKTAPGKPATATKPKKTAEEKEAARAAKAAAKTAKQAQAQAAQATAIAVQAQQTSNVAAAQAEAAQVQVEAASSGSQEMGLDTLASLQDTLAPVNMRRRNSRSY